ncbi:hypothetical protein VTK26DRAFT_992 [Humicola hyalothermophila]
MATHLSASHRPTTPSPSTFSPYSPSTKPSPWPSLDPDPALDPDSQRGRKRVRRQDRDFAALFTAAAPVATKSTWLPNTTPLPPTDAEPVVRPASTESSTFRGRPRRRSTSTASSSSSSLLRPLSCRRSLSPSSCRRCRDTCDGDGGGDRGVGRMIAASATTKAAPSLSPLPGTMRFLRVLQVERAAGKGGGEAASVNMMGEGRGRRRRRRQRRRSQSPSRSRPRAAVVDAAKGADGVGGDRGDGERRRRRRTRSRGREHEGLGDGVAGECRKGTRAVIVDVDVVVDGSGM